MVPVLVVPSGDSNTGIPLCKTCFTAFYVILKSIVVNNFFSLYAILIHGIALEHL